MLAFSGRLWQCELIQILFSATLVTHVLPHGPFLGTSSVRVSHPLAGSGSVCADTGPVPDHAHRLGALTVWVLAARAHPVPVPGHADHLRPHCQWAIFPNARDPEQERAGLQHRGTQPDTQAWSKRPMMIKELQAA
eukprot:872589-Pelagomonas_calceolata.AAC.3